MTPAEIEEKYLLGDFQLKHDFENSQSEREGVLQNCEKYAAWTLPVQFPRDPLMEHEEMQHDYQSVGAQLVNNLANKVATALFPPGQPFFRNELNAEQRTVLQTETSMSDAAIDATLAASEREAMRMFASKNHRAEFVDALIQLVITGNALIKFDAKVGSQLWTLRDYIVDRDLMGNVTRIILRETKAYNAMSDEVQRIAREHNYDETCSELTLFTGIVRMDDGRFIVWQELEDIAYVHEQVGIYTDDTLPWIPLVFAKCRNKNYGTGHVETYAGDFHTLSTLAEATLDFTTLVTDVKTLVDPAGMTDVRQIQDAASGAYVPGKEDDLYVHTPQVANNGAILETRFDSVTRRLSAAFLMSAGTTRDAERVTAEEIRRTAHELEGSLGGVYSRLANELQRPIAKRLSTAVDSVFTQVEPTIVTGLESLSRTSDLDRMRMMLQDLIVLSEVPEQVADRLDYNNLIKLLGAGHQVDYEKFLLTEEQVKANQQKRAQQQAQAAGMEAGAVAQAQPQQ